MSKESDAVLNDAALKDAALKDAALKDAVLEEKKPEDNSKNDEDLLYTHKPENRGNSMQWNSAFCRRPGH
ncbi:hypothetical protein [Methanosarcina sp.]|uniref:hypothetical protein n=1 Tax=Methanosarcina sp. TaxID=2213 RepID=UPI0029892EA1|nr:hypothetical protein [Methanosarcina sp.]MDW5550423.1 hypothetical protein [Methanosarcina sp.]MDW5554747.1 hypothetical protein [Methanosarcina sp.]MDW5559954.1 hypothetical protein [Methanosarcina sp.]